MSENFRRTILVLVLWIAGLCAAMQFAKIAVPFSDVRLLYPDVGNGAGWLLSIISLVGAVLGGFAGALVGRLGAVRILLGGLLIGSMISFWHASIPSFPIMLVSRTFEGVSHLAIVVAAPTLIAQISSDRFRGAAMTLWSTFFGVSFGLFVWLGMPFVQTWGLSNIFVVHGTAMIAVAGLSAFLLRHHNSHDYPADKLQFCSIAEKLLQAYRSSSISTPGIGWLFYTLTFVALLAIIPERLPDESRSWASGIMPLTGIAVSIIAVPLLLRVMKATSIVMLGFGCALIVIVFPSGASLTYISIALFSVLGLVQGASFAAVPELNQSSETQALSYGIMAQMGNLGNLLGTPILLFVLDQSGESALFAIVAAVYGFAIAAYLLLGWRYSSHPR